MGSEALYGPVGQKSRRRRRGRKRRGYEDVEGGFK